MVNKTLQLEAECEHAAAQLLLVNWKLLTLNLNLLPVHRILESLNCKLLTVNLSLLMVACKLFTVKCKFNMSFFYSKL